MPGASRTPAYLICPATGVGCMHCPLTQMRRPRPQAINQPKVTSQKRQSWDSVPALHPKVHSLTWFCPAQTVSQALAPEVRPTVSVHTLGRQGPAGAWPTSGHLACVWKGAQRSTRGHLLARPTVPTGQHSWSGPACLFLWTLQPPIAKGAGLGPHRAQSPGKGFQQDPCAPYSSIMALGRGPGDPLEGVTWGRTPASRASQD